MTANTYEEGLRDGRLATIEAMQAKQNERMDHHERRLQIAERILYGLMGALVLVQLIPLFKSFTA